MENRPPALDVGSVACQHCAMRKALIAILVLAAIALGVAAYLFTTLNDQTTASVPEILTEFRDTKGADNPAAGFPKQGVYRYRVEGQEHISRGPIDVTRTLPTEAAALVRHTGTGFDVDTRYSGEHREFSHYEVKPDGTYVTSATTTLQVGPIKTVKERAWKPELLRFPRTKTSWGGDYKTGDMTAVVKAAVRPSEAVDVGGKRVQGKVVNFTQTISGEYSGTREETFWLSDTGVILRYKIVSSLTGPTNLDFTADQTLAALEPDV